MQIGIARCVTKGPLLAGTLGVAAFGWAVGDTPPEHVQDEIVVTARASDAVMAAKVETAIASNPYILGDHVTVTVTHGVVRVGGLVRGEVSDLLAILRVARRVAGKARVVNEIEFQPIDDEGP